MAAQRAVMVEVGVELLLRSTRAGSSRELFLIGGLSRSLMGLVLTWPITKLSSSGGMQKS